MSTDLLRDVPLRDGGDTIRVVVECAAGTRVKLKYDDTLGVFVWSRLLPAGVRFPYDVGFLPQTLAEDGDALDAIVLAAEATHPGVIIPCRAVGALRVEQQRAGGPIKRNDRVLAVPVHDHANGVTDITDVAPRLLAELEAFHSASLALTGKSITLRGWANATETAALIQTASHRFGGRC